ncbi:MAG: PIN domain-containing protein [Methanomassiliicoccales archaeon]|jgi:hypothetical protein|nr:PIN domain-containing protein [Methanomassiliicoccales archaeon]
MNTIVCKDFLMAVMNNALLQEVDRFVVHSDLLDLDLLKIDLRKKRIERVVERNDFDEATSQIRSKLSTEYLREEIPDYSDLKEVFQGSLQAPLNLEDLLVELEEIERRMCDPLKYPRLKCIGVDTNIAYKRLLSRLRFHRNFRRLDDKGKSKNVQILVPMIVHSEISKRIGRKYSQKEIAELSRALGDQTLMKSFFNCCYMSGRKALNAQTELKVLRELYTCIDIVGGEFFEDREKRDSEIVRALASHCDGQKLDVVFLTADDKCRAHALAHKISSLWMNYPHDIEENCEFDEWLMVEFLYDLAVVFGVISFHDLGVKVMGDWSGKTMNDYYAQKVKIIVEKGASLEMDLERDFKILAELMCMLQTSDIN